MEIDETPRGTPSDLSVRPGPSGAPLGKVARADVQPPVSNNDDDEEGQNKEYSEHAPRQQRTCKGHPPTRPALAGVSRMRAPSDPRKDESADGDQARQGQQKEEEDRWEGKQDASDSDRNQTQDERRGAAESGALLGPGAFGPTATHDAPSRIVLASR